MKSSHLNVKWIKNIPHADDIPYGRGVVHMEMSVVKSVAWLTNYTAQPGFDSRCG